jgi:hypothetical protein
MSGRSARSAVDVSGHHAEVCDTRGPNEIAGDAPGIGVRCQRGTSDSGVTVCSVRAWHSRDPRVEALLAQLELEVLLVRVHH